MKEIFEEHLYNSMKNDHRIVAFFADSDFSKYEELKSEFPDRFFNFGITECNTVAAAAGMAKSSEGNVIPVVYTAGAFIVYRAYEFVRNDVCIHNLNVKFVGMGSGLKINNFGPTHHTTEDIAVLRVLPNMCILLPASPKEVPVIFDSCLKHIGPTYIRLGKAFEEEIYSSTPEFEIGKSTLLRSGKDITIISTGSIISNAIAAADMLAKDGYNAEIINMTSLKPIDSDRIIKSAKKTGKIVTVEEHQIVGGLGGAVSEILCSNSISACFERVGLKDEFCTKYGWHRDLLEIVGLSTEDILSACRRVISRRV